ncbi:MAG: BMP family ABC transporter substrate-binding protein [Ilumatobacteraceae bacterium]
MIKSKRILALGVIAALGFTAAACGSDDDSSASTDAPADSTAPVESDAPADSTATSEAPAGSTPAGDCTVGVVYDITGRGDKSFNDAAGAGLDQAIADLGVVGSESTPTGDGDRAERVTGLVDDGNGLVVGVGFLFGDSMTAAAAAAPDTSFAIIDSVIEAPNVASLVFAEEQGSFLVGAAAALKSESGIIGFIGGVENELIQKFEAGYAAGAQAVNPDIEILTNYISQPPDFSGFNDPAKGKELAAAQYEAGADVVYSAAGGSGLGAFEAAAAAGEPGTVWAIGVDSDQYELVSPELQPYILTSMLKKVDVATYDTIAAFCGGEFVGGVQTYDIASDGVGYSTSGGFVDDIAADLDAYAEQIASGEIVVPTAP